MKLRLDDLALFGGRPAFPAPVHIGVPNIGDRKRFLKSVNDILDRRYLSNRGPVAREFERQVAELVEVEHCVATCNATAALQLAIRAAGLTGEVIVPSFTFPATPHSVHWLGLTPVFCDVDPSGNIDVDRLGSVLTRRASGIMAVHLWGRPCNVDRLAEFAAAHGLKLLYDSAHAFGCSAGGRMIGGFGDAEVFSFHATKVVNSFEGGALVTNDDSLAERARSLSNFGIVSESEVAEPGTNAKMSEVAAAMGLASLAAMPAFVARNRENHEAYQAELAGVPGLRVLDFDHRERNNYQYVVLDVDVAIAGVSRDVLTDALRAENIMGRRYFTPGCHRTAAYRDRVHAPMPGTEELAERLVVLPSGTATTPRDIAVLCQVVRFVVSHAAEVAASMSDQVRAGVEAL
ncbi:DegT/DnrJ/EryC1/StrS aminotransferase family protein [Kutzneria buriramensis]|uniref:dTDP-4-amino-4,6-dideoxyglucose n=1 Tax=Kutzneria buriramensis TaxID=1045776 RepID=A0A3E0HF85_9PSEU|nr:DegT/DnrJ/EryC1/StrS family aminotransferase [Kutzneria buriramensis]REH43726.1 dTDP-4-amino-4,6-dideoxyglucose [Kutzneria buriramensis]